MNLSDTIDAVMFDMDGLLFDTERLFFEAMQSAGREAGHEVPRELFASMIGHTREHNYLQLRQYYGASFAAEEFHALCHRHMEGLVRQRLRMKPGVVEMLDWLDAASIPRALVTSSRRSSVDHHLAAFALTDKFHEIVAHGDYIRGKPDPEPYLLAAERLSADPARCLALEDSFNGVRSAAAAGMMTVMVPDLLEPTDEMRGLCHAIVPDLEAVRGLLTIPPN